MTKKEHKTKHTEESAAVKETEKVNDNVKETSFVQKMIDSQIKNSETLLKNSDLLKSKSASYRYFVVILGDHIDSCIRLDTDILFLYSRWVDIY